MKIDLAGIITIMSKYNMSQFMKEAGLDRASFKEMVGVKTRTTRTITNDCPIPKKSEDKKKCTRLEQYAPPEIRKLIKMEKLGEE